MYKSAAPSLRPVVSYAVRCLVLLLLLAPCADAQCRVEGTVRAADGAPVVGATVRIISASLKTPPSATTGPDGHYVFENVKPGIWAEIRVTGTGSPIVRAFALITKWKETIDIKADPEAAEPATLDDLDAMGGDAGEVRGIVRAGDGSPIVGAMVSIGDTPVGTRTDSAGRYSFGKLRAGLSITLTAAASGYEGAHQIVAVPGSGAADADFALSRAGAAGDGAPDLQVVDVSGDSESVGLDPARVMGLPAVSRNDVFRAVQFLPSANGTLEDSSRLFVRGGTPDRTLMTYDGFTWYPFPRLFGFASALNTETIGEASFADDMFGASRGGRLGGSLRLNGATPATTRPTGAVDVSTFGLAANVSVPIGSRASIALGGRQSPGGSLYNDVLDRFGGTDVAWARDRVPRFTTGALASSPRPEFHDITTRVDVMPTTRDHVSFTLYEGHDQGNVSRDFALPAPSTAIAIPSLFELPSDAVVQGADVQRWTGRGLSAVWRHSAANVTATASVGRSRFTDRHDQEFFLTSPSTGEDLSAAAARGGSDGLSETNDVQDTTVRGDAAIRFGFNHALDVGGEIVRLDSDYGNLQASGTTLVPFLSQTGTGTIVTGFAQDVWRPSGRLTVSPGVRLTRYDPAGSSYVEPRVTATYELRQQVRFSAGWGINHQVMNAIVREDREHGDGEFWALSNGTSIPVARAQQVAGGVTAEGRGVLFDAQVYYERLDDLTLFAPRLLPGPIPQADTSMFHVGSGTSAGLDVLIQHRVGWNSIWSSVAAGRTEYKYPSLEAAAFPASNDQRAEFKAADTARLPAGLSVGAAFVAGTGRPYTPFTQMTQVWFPAGALAYEPAFAAKNSARLPPYTRLDVSGEFARRFGAVTSTVGVTVFNVYDRKNILTYDTEGVGDTAAVNDVPMMSRAFNAFFRVGF